MSLAAFSLMGIDKHRARTGGWRVREATFFIIAALGGTLGAILGMYTFHHKTRHRNFVCGLPILGLLQLTLLIFITIACRKNLLP